uniref:C2H2-type domain-containing protein n=1 Tax=Timema genevievae TaxID=629358 RepID=A0A7R9JYY1_TIMGE|nr:unnamed protein product [Timema genevievae]
MFNITNLMNKITDRRGFSCHNRLKTAYRNSLKTEKLDDLLEISINGPSLSEIDPTAVIDKRSPKQELNLDLSVLGSLAKHETSVLANYVTKAAKGGHDREVPGKSSQDDTSSDQSAEGFLCPKCLKAFPTPEKLQSHYETDHEADEHSIASQESGSSYGVQATNQQTSDLFLYTERGPTQEIKGAHQVQGPSLEEIAELRMRLHEALANNVHLEQEKKHLEQKAAQLAQDYVTVKAHSDEGDSIQLSMKERLKVLEAHVAHRESIDDTAVLRQELVQVQRVMDELNQERERERDELKTELDLYKEKYGDIHKETSRKDNIESLSLLLTTTKDELLKLQKEHSELLDNIQANEGSSTALQQLNQMNLVIILSTLIEMFYNPVKIMNSRLRITDPEQRPHFWLAEVKADKHMFLRIMCFGELSFQIENLHLQHTEKDLEIDSLKKILQEKTEKLAETANTIHGLEKNTSELEKLEKNMMEFKTNLEVEMSDLSIDCNTKVSELSEMIFNMKIDLESACTDAKNYKLQLSENAKLHEELKQNYESLLMLCSVEVKEENVRVELWNEINEVLNACEPGERIILLGDMNGWGVRQGCVMAPWLFNVFMDKCMRDACEDAIGVQMDNVKSPCANTCLAERNNSVIPIHRGTLVCGALSRHRGITALGDPPHNFLYSLRGATLSDWSIVECCAEQVQVDFLHLAHDLRIFFESVCHQSPQFVSPGTTLLVEDNQKLTSVCPTNLLDAISDRFLGDTLLDFPENVGVGFAFISSDHQCVSQDLGLPQVRLCLEAPSSHRAVSFFSPSLFPLRPGFALSVSRRSPSTSSTSASELYFA